MIARALLIAAASVAVAFSSYAAENPDAPEDPDDVPAKPISPRPPAYPAACEPASLDDATRETVTVMYEVTYDGRPQNVRVRETSNSCFNDAAVSAIRNWDFEPRRINGRRRPQEDLETTFAFVLEEETQASTFDARPVKRVPPYYPENCMHRADDLEIVVVSFTVTEEGKTTDVEVAESTNRCLNAAAKRSVRKWRYEPKIVAGAPVRRLDVRTELTFELGRDAAWRVRSAFRRELGRARKEAKKNGEPGKALIRLQEIEAKYGADFSQAESAEFYWARADLRLQQKDYRGALDDLRIVRSSGVAQMEVVDKIDETMVQLEAVIAAQDAEASADGDR